MSDVKTKQKAVAALEFALIQRVRSMEGVSRIELAREMSLAPSTIGLYVDRLITEGVLREGQKGPSSAGRPPTIVELNPHLGEFIGIDFEARQLSAAAIDFSQESLHQRREKIRATDSADTVIEKIKNTISEIAGRGRQLLGIGVGVPGTVDNRRGIAVHYEFIRGWRNIPLAERLAKQFGVPVYLENNIRAMALAERWFGCARDVDHFVCIGIRSGIGAGLVIDGKLHCGSNNMAGEIGGWACHPDDHLHDAPTDTLEHKASVRAILEHLTQAVRAAVKSSLTLDANQTVTLDELVRAARDGDPLTTKVLMQSGTYLGRTISQINLLLNPGLIIIAGPLAEFDEAFLQPIRDTVERLTPRLHGRVPQIVASQIGEYGGALGAAALAVHHWKPR